MTVPGLGDGLGGVTTQPHANKTREVEEPSSATPQGEPTPAQVSNVQVNVDLHQVSHMETTDFSEELMQISCPDLTPINRVIKSIPNSSPFHNRLQVFENQIEEIDLALKKFDSHTPSTINKPAVTPTHADPLGDKSGEIIDIQGDTADSNSPHVTNHNTSHDTIALRTWKRLARNNIPPENPINHSVTHKRNRECDKSVYPELPTKKLLVSKDEKNNLLVEAAKQPRQEP
nr:hypothetical protein CFP56_51627 [Quercus suber]